MQITETRNEMRAVMEAPELLERKQSMLFQPLDWHRFADVFDNLSYNKAMS